MVAEHYDGADKLTVAVAFDISDGADNLTVPVAVPIDITDRAHAVAVAINIADGVINLDRHVLGGSQPKGALADLFPDGRYGGAERIAALQQGAKTDAGVVRVERFDR